MSLEIARYQFHSWSRRGISLDISETDDLGAGTSTQMERAQIPVGVTLNGTSHAKNFLLIGPGDIIGVNSNMIVKTEPLSWITNYEPNYLAYVEFYDEDFAWRYTPAAPSGDKLRPWLLLLVLKAGEFTRGGSNVPLPTIKVTGNDVFPPDTEAWLWAHMHSNADIPDSELSDLAKFLLSLNQSMDTDPDQVYCRLLCPRQLEPNTAYNAFLVPAFETGRLAGLQEDTTTTHAQTPSWGKNGANGDMPVYYEWYFRTGVDEDFESLVNMLQPVPLDPSVGARDMDCSAPGFVEAENPGQPLPGTQPPIIGLEGALKSPAMVSTVFPNPPASNEFQVELQKIANLPVTIIGTSTSGDPVVSVPIYGSNHAKTSATDVVTLDITKDNWVNDLNRDPRTRVAGGLGTTVVQNNQSYLMPKAWAQVASVLQANKLIKVSVFLMKVAVQFTQKTLGVIPQASLLAISKPVLSRVLGSPTTVWQQIGQSRVPLAVLSGTFRRLTRPSGKFMKKLTATGSFDFGNLVTGLNNGTLTAGPVPVTPAGLPNTQTIAGQIGPISLPAWLQWLIAHRLWLLIVLLIVWLVLALVTGAFLVFGLLALATIGVYIYLGNLQKNTTAATNLADPQAELNSLSSIPPQPVFTLYQSDESTTPPPTLTTAGADSVEAANFRKALPDIDSRLAFTVPEPAFTNLDVNNAYSKVSTAIHPYTSFPLRLSARIKFPGYISLLQPDKIFPAMAYPDFEDPMYKYLTAMSQELLMPNIKTIAPNSISLAETNPKFIESYMVGLNHEMGRELLWNGYPTDERGSYFRQFWEVKGLIEPSTTLTEAQQTEAYKDIKPIDTWGGSSLLGSHNNRAPAGSTAGQAVLIIRGELLKRYPNTLIYAQKAIAGARPDLPPVINQTLTDQEFPLQVKFPLYKGDATPDIKFLGFDLTIDQAKGTAASPGFTDQLGWFFVIQEVPGEPRFGMDITPEPDAGGPSWADLSWQDFTDPGMAFITASDAPTVTFPQASLWGKDAASMAYILFRRPSMVAIHATDMLEGINPI